MADAESAVHGCRYSVAIMVDTEGSEVHLQEIDQPVKVEVTILTNLEHVGCGP